MMFYYVPYILGFFGIFSVVENSIDYHNNMMSNQWRVETPVI